MISAGLSDTGERVVRTSYFRMATRRPAPVLPTADVLGFTIATPSLPELAEWFHAAAKARGRDAKVMTFAEPAVADARTRALLARTDAVLAHGVGIGAYARLATSPVSVHDPLETLEAMLSAGDRNDPVRVFFAGVGALAWAQHYANREGVTIVGASERIGALEDVNEACPEVVIAFGAAALEWAVENSQLLDVGLVVTVPTESHKNRIGFVAAVGFLLRAFWYLAFSARRAGSLPAPR